MSYTEQGDKKNLIFKTNEKIGWKVVGVMFDEEIIQAAIQCFIRLWLSSLSLLHLVVY